MQLHLFLYMHKKVSQKLAEAAWFVHSVLNSRWAITPVVRFYRTPEQYCLKICQCRLKVYSMVNSKVVNILWKYSSHSGMPAIIVYPAELHLTVVWCSKNKSL